MIHLLDVNVLLALGFDAHEHHGRVAAWVASLPAGDELATCPITELGFVRVLRQAAAYKVTIADAKELLRRLKASRSRRCILLPDHPGAARLPGWVKTARQTTDGHLLVLARAHGADLVTLDRGIPGARVLPAAQP